MLCHYQEVGSDNCIQFCQQEHCVMRVNIYFIESFSSICITGTFAQLIVECAICITLVNDQLDAQFFYFIIRLLQSSTCFEQRRAHHQEVKLY